MKGFNMGKNPKGFAEAKKNNKDALIEQIKKNEQEKVQKIDQQMNGENIDPDNVVINEDKEKQQRQVHFEEELNIRDEQLSSLQERFEVALNENKELKDKVTVFEEKSKELDMREKLLREQEVKIEAREAEYVKEKRELDEEKRRLELSKNDIEHTKRLTEGLRKELLIKEADLVRAKQMLESKEQEITAKEDSLDSELQKRRLETESLIKEKSQKAIAESERIKQDAIEEANKLKSQLIQELATQRGKAEKELALWKETEIKSLTESYNDLRIAFDQDLADKRIAFYEKMSADVSKEKDYRLKELEAEIADKRQVLSKEYENIKSFQNELQDRKDELEKKLQNYEIMKQELSLEKIKIQKQNSRLEQRSNELDQEVASRYKKTIDMYEDKIQILYDQLDKITSEYNLVYNDLLSFQHISDMFPGKTGNMLMQRLKDLENTKSELEKELVQRPDSSIKEELAKLKGSYERLNQENVLAQNRIVELQAEHNEYNKLKAERDGLDYELEYTKIELDTARKKVQQLEIEVKRLSSSEVMLEEYEKRLQDIRQGLAELKDVRNPINDEGQPKDEIEWLNKISKNCYDYGIAFPKRILYAFHTALKISDWSTITVLAGVSGTGKSELPRLYSVMGRVNFINVPVQPNWDSQESMLGYYNSIDNKFDAQPALRFLVECTEKLDNCMGIVLLDEMNLAHVEYYFAEFLSKLELRRGSAKNNVPSVEVKLGAGVRPYQLMLKRNILWCGTMNQDETTKSLSDKVLDRGIVINFPRPKSLKGRSRMANLAFFSQERKLSDEPMLSYETWTKWRVVNLEKEKDGVPGFNKKQLDELKRLRAIVEKINDCLGNVGRALGHRVWQSIEFYIANYPEVISAKKSSKGELTSELKNAMHIAFEDQLVQKVMPKLRGIDTRGSSKEKCLDPIKQILISEGFNNLESDFDRAMQLGYGQFMWCSADFIDVDDIAGIVKEDRK